QEWFLHHQLRLAFDTDAAAGRVCGIQLHDRVGMQHGEDSRKGSFDVDSASVVALVAAYEEIRQFQAAATLEVDSSAAIPRNVVLDRRIVQVHGGSRDSSVGVDATAKAGLVIEKVDVAREQSAVVEVDSASVLAAGRVVGTADLQ